MKDMVVKLRPEDEGHAWGDTLVVEPTHGIMDHEWKARIVDNPGCGSGHNIGDAIQSLADSYREVAALLDQRAKNYYEGKLTC